jgi:hypothetical protein
MYYLVGLVWMILTNVTGAQDKPANQEPPRSLSDIVKIMDIQIPGWQRQGDPAVNPVIKDGETKAIVITTRFRSGEQALKINLTTADKTGISKIIANASKEHARPLQIKGFQAFQVSPPVSAFDEYENNLNIIVADRFVINIQGQEVLDNEVLVKVADLLDLKKLAALP